MQAKIEWIVVVIGGDGRRKAKKLLRHATGFQFNFEVYDAMARHCLSNFIWAHIFRKSSQKNIFAEDDVSFCMNHTAIALPEITLHIAKKHSNLASAWMHAAWYGPEKKITNHNQTLSCTNLFTWIALNLFLPEFLSLTRFLSPPPPSICYAWQFCCESPKYPTLVSIYTYMHDVLFLICRCFVFYLRIHKN